MSGIRMYPAFYKKKGWDLIMKRLYTALALVIMSCLYYSSLTLSFMQNKSQAVPNRVYYFQVIIQIYR